MGGVPADGIESSQITNAKKSPVITPIADELGNQMDAFKNKKVAFTGGTLLADVSGGALSDGQGDGSSSANLPEMKSILRSRDRLMEKATERISDPSERARFNEDLNTFIKRAPKDGVSLNEIRRTCDELGKLMDGNQVQPIDLPTRVKIAEEVADQLARPTTIDQGKHHSCPSGSIEPMMYTTDPFEATRAVCEMAIRGRYTTANGHQVKMYTQLVNPDGKGVKEIYDPSLSPDVEAAEHLKPGVSLRSKELDGKRSYASQIFHLVAANTYWSQCDTLPDGNGTKVTPGSIRYVQHTPKDGDTGERLMDYSKSPPIEIKDKNGQVYDEPHLSMQRMASVYGSMTGKPALGRFLAVNPRVTNPSGEEQHNGVIYVRDERLLEHKLAELRRKGNYPVVVDVNSDRLHQLAGEFKVLPQDQGKADMPHAPSAVPILNGKNLGGLGASELEELIFKNSLDQYPLRINSGVNRLESAGQLPNTLAAAGGDIYSSHSRESGSESPRSDAFTGSPFDHLRSGNEGDSGERKGKGTFLPEPPRLVPACDDSAPNPADDSPADENGSNSRRHMATIREPEQSIGVIKIGLDNQWGSANDFLGKPGTRPKITVHQLFNIMGYGSQSDN